MAKRFVMASLAFVGLIVPGTLAMALLAAPPAGSLQRAHNPEKEEPVFGQRFMRNGKNAVKIFP